MARWRLLVVIPAALTVAIGIAVPADPDPVPLYTSEDLDRMFGPAPAPPSDPVDKSSPEDWRWVEQFLDRQYSRIDADRQFELGSRSVDIAAARVEPAVRGYGRPLAWSLGAPASTWWNVVRSKYASSTGGATCENGPPCERDRWIETVRAPRGTRGHGRKSHK